MREGFDFGLEMSGKPAAMRSMLAAMCHGGKVAMLGLPSEDFGIDWAHVVTNMITIRGIYGREMFETWYWMSVFVHAGLDVSPVITHRFAAEEFESAFDVVKAAECGKVVLSWADR
jgi:threonine 3-dehydrogenase